MLLHERDVRVREDAIRMMRAEGERWDDLLQAAERRLGASGGGNGSGSCDGNDGADDEVGDDDVRAWRRALAEARKEAPDLERTAEECARTLEEQNLLRESMSPRSIQGGWGEAIDAGLRETRERLTKCRLRLVFDVRRREREAESGLRSGEEDAREARDERDRWRAWEGEGLNELWDRRREYRLRDGDLRARMRVADERRKWAVDLRVPSGKPDKRRRAGGMRTQTEITSSSGAFCSAAVDLLADRRNQSAACTEVDGRVRRSPRVQDEKIEGIIGEIELLSYRSQVQQFRSLLEPLDGAIEAW